MSGQRGIPLNSANMIPLGDRGGSSSSQPNSGGYSTPPQAKRARREQLPSYPTAYRPNYNQPRHSRATDYVESGSAEFEYVGKAAEKMFPDVR